MHVPWQPPTAFNFVPAAKRATTMSFGFGVSRRVVIIAVTLLVFIFVLTLRPKEAFVSVGMIS
jgi:hypothetical protein